MSEPIPERADIRQLRIQAKELLRSLSNGEKLADAQLAIARKYGFDSWPKLVESIEKPVLLDKFKRAIYEGDLATLERLLRTKSVLRKHLDDPMFDFDSPAVVFASHHPHAETLLPLLVKYGADLNVRSKWWAGGFGALDHASSKTADLLVELGAKFDVFSAASQGRIDVLRQLLDVDPASVNAPGGDGQRPLHVAKTPEIAELLIQRGADLEICDIDHESTPIQYHANNSDILRILVKRGAKPDIFTAVILEDVDLVKKILEENPAAAEARTGSPPFVTTKSNGGHIYIYLLGNGKTPTQVAAERGNRAVLDHLTKESSPVRRLIAAAWLEDNEAVEEILRNQSNFVAEIGTDARAITDAAQAGQTETVRLLLTAGFDPNTPGMDSGSALHVACWFGYVDIVRLLVDRVPVDLKDRNHGSPPLGWAAHGSQWCNNPKGDYVAVVEALVVAGADLNAPANSGGTSMLDQAGQREDVKDVLRKYGAI
ncbi:MAG: ankyrin repeat domain-containing protein [Armatimonadota bacterium]